MRDFAPVFRHPPHVPRDEQVRGRKRVLGIVSPFIPSVKYKTPHILQIRRLDLRRQIRPLQNLVPRHALVLQMARPAADGGDLRVVVLIHERAEHRARRRAVPVVDDGDLVEGEGRRGGDVDDVAEEAGVVEALGGGVGDAVDDEGLGGVHVVVGRGHDGVVGEEGVCRERISDMVIP